MAFGFHSFKPYLTFFLFLTLLLASISTTEAYSREQTLVVQKIASEHNGSDFVFAEEPEAKKELWKVCLTKYDLIVIDPTHYRGLFKLFHN